MQTTAHLVGCCRGGICWDAPTVSLVGCTSRSSGRIHDDSSTGSEVRAPSMSSGMAKASGCSSPYSSSSSSRKRSTSSILWTGQLAPPSRITYKSGFNLPMVAEVSCSSYDSAKQMSQLRLLECHFMLYHLLTQYSQSPRTKFLVMLTANCREVFTLAIRIARCILIASFAIAVHTHDLPWRRFELSDFHARWLRVVASAYGAQLGLAPSDVLL